MKKHILIVDDEADIRDLLGQFLGNNGYRATTAASASAAFAAIEKEAPDLIFSDLQLEHSDGLEMIATIRLKLPTTPVILLTGVLFDSKVVDSVLKDKVACYLPKTSPLSKILETVHRLIG